jgi:hypothetical protein
VESKVEYSRSKRPKGKAPRKIVLDVGAASG